MTTEQFLAVYGALVSTAVGVWTILNIYRDKARLQVRATFAFLTREMPDREASEHLSLTIVNVGRRQIIIEGCGLVMAGTKTLMHYLPYPGEFPRRLQEAESMTVLIRMSVLRSSLRKEGALAKKVWVRDATGRPHKAQLSQGLRQALNGTGRQSASPQP